jgi:hypothetical protein
MELPAMMIAMILGPFLVVFGLSHILYANVWVKLFKGWEKDHHTLLPIMLLLFISGLIVVNMYNIWAWNTWLLVTLMGWGMLLKGAFYLLLPGSLLKKGIKMGEHVGFQYLGGLMMVIIGACLSYSTYFV